MVAATNALSGAKEPAMQHLEKVFEVDCPVSTVYNQWTQFEDFPEFMSGVEEVRQLDPTHVHWRANFWGKAMEWDAEITEQEPDRRISWKSVNGAMNAGTVRFKPLSPDRTEVRLVMAYQPESAAEKVGDALGIVKGRVAHTARDFKSFIENLGSATGAWRQEVIEGRAYPTPEGYNGWPRMS
jgi:uncharacterized membrane protein